MKTVCEINKCNGCGACVCVCNQNAISFIDDIRYLNAYIDESKCIKCNKCRKICPNINAVKKRLPLFLKQGWSKTDIRKNSSSGGIATELMKSFVSNGGYVCSCKYINDKCVYVVTNKVTELKCFSGSKYVKSDPKDVFIIINNLLEHKKVLFIGLPCHSAALQNFVSLSHKNNLYTVDLICHGTPSQKIFDKFLKENKQLSSVGKENLSFRNKNHFFVHKKEERTKKCPDDYTLLFLDGVAYSENCYKCNYATNERCSDLTIGDSWGSELTNEKDKGISLVLCQTKKGEELLQNDNLELLSVNEEKAFKSNEQLNHPFVVNDKKRNIFFKLYENNCSIAYISWRLFFMKKIKNIIKTIIRY